MLLHLIFTAALVIRGGTSIDTEIPWWNIRLLFSQITNVGLGVENLQNYFESEFQWQTKEIDGSLRLQEMIQKVSRLTNRSIDMVSRMKRVIEEEFATWEPQPANKSNLCCENQYFPDGCALINTQIKEEPTRASSPPPSVLREMKYNEKLDLGGNITYQYFSFSDGSTYAYPALTFTRKESMSICTDYDPRLRYFYNQCKSPEPRDVVLTVHGNPSIRPLLKDAAKRIFNSLSLLDRMGLCLPGPNGCHHGTFGDDITVNNPSWPGRDLPLNRRQMLPSNMKNKKKLKKMLDLWPNTSNTFSSHLAAVEAGLDFLNTCSNHPLNLSTDVHHRVLIYIFGEKDWANNFCVYKKLEAAVLNGTSIIVHLIPENDKSSLQEITLLEHNNVSLKVVPFSGNIARYSFPQPPEQLDAVLTIHGNPSIRPFLKEAANGIFNSLISFNQVELCLPSADGCHNGTFGNDIPVNNTSWVVSETPPRTPMSSINRNMNELKGVFDFWINTTDTFANFSAAVEAGLDFLNTRSEHPLNMSTVVHHRVLIYIFSEKDWASNFHVHEKLEAAVLNGTSVIVQLIPEAAKADLQEVTLLEHNNVSLKIVPFSTKYQINIPSFGLISSTRPIIVIPYWDAFEMGYIISICMALVFRGEFIGAVCNDAYVVNLIADTTNNDIENARVFLVNSGGITVMHPLLPSPHSYAEDPVTVTIDKLEQGKTSRALLTKILAHKTGREDIEKGVIVEALGWPPDTSLSNAVREKSAHLRYLWNPIPQTDLILVLVLPLINGKVVSTSYRCSNMTACETKSFYYHKARPGDTSRRYCKYFGKPVVNDEGLVKFSPDSFNNVMGYLQNEGDELISQIYSIFTGSRHFNELLRTDLRASVKLAKKAVSEWKSAKKSIDYIGVRHMGTADGVLISYPGTEMKSTYDHRDRPWYQLAISSVNCGIFSMSTPHCSQYTSSMVYTLASSLRSATNAPLAVVNGEFAFQHIKDYFLKYVPPCNYYICLLVDHMGYVVLMTSWLSNESTNLKCDNASDITAAHIVSLVPHIARDMISNGLLRRRGCHDYEKDITFYYWRVSMTGYKTLHKGDTYEVHKIVESNLYFVIANKGLGQDRCYCNSNDLKDLMECYDTCKMECQCPCKAGPNTQPCRNAEDEIHSSRWSMPACQPSDPSFPVPVTNLKQEEDQERIDCCEEGRASCS